MNQTHSGLIALSGIVLLSISAIVKQAVDNNAAHRLNDVKLSAPLAKPTPNLGMHLEQGVTKISYTHRDIECLARNIYFEARSESTIGQYAIANVTINRVLAKRKSWGNSVCSVVYARKQFSWTLKAKYKTAKLKGDAWVKAKKIAVESLDHGVRVKELDKALFYHATYVNPDWRDNRNRIKSIGAHIFYTRAKGDSIKL
jgi:spore germination cell wall hydrolase CwlJ-like protein